MGLVPPKIGPYGAGIGGPVQTVENPNDPSFDSANSISRDTRIRQCIENPSLTDWERNFLSSIYGIDRMTAKQRMVFIRISQKVMRVEKGK